VVKFVVNLTTVQFPDFEVIFLCPDWGVEVSLHDGGAMGYTLALRIRGGEGGDFIQPGSEGYRREKPKAVHM
jgi:hypothetical protein